MYDGRTTTLPRSACASTRRLSGWRLLPATVILVVAAGAFATLGGASAAQAHDAGGAVVSEESDTVPFYVVQQSFGGQQEFLFEIAQRFLGDGNRFNEIFELNKGRPQPDGGALTTPTSLLPGWILQLPADAKGAEVQFGPLPGASPAKPQPRPQPTQSGAASASPRATPTPTRTQAPHNPATPRPAATLAAASSNTGLPVVLWIILGLVLLGAAGAGAYFWFTRRKGRPRSSQPALPVADRSASWTIDSALKILVGTCEEEQIRFPGLYLVTVGDSAIEVLLSTPSARVPSGWTASSDGRTWSASLAYLQGQRVPDVSNEHFSRLATLGATDNGRLLLNFQHANGPISVEGSSSAVSDVVEGWLSEFTSNPWSGSPNVVRLGAREAAGHETLEKFLGRLDGVETGIAVLENPPTRAQGESLRALFARPDFDWIFIIKGPYAGASWTFTASDGLLRSSLVPDVRYSAFSGNRQPGSVAPA